MIYRNIRLAYCLSALKSSWFWLGIWVFYYLRFTNYGGIGIIETILITTTTIAEIPTGAIADLLGKRITLIFAFIFEAAGGFLMAFAPSFPVLALSVFVMCLGGALYSGTLDALVFDSLKQVSNEKHYDKVISNVNTVQFITPAICAAIGGFMYAVSPRLPFVANAIAYSIGIILSFFLKEPSVDTQQFTVDNFIRQTKQGIFQLTKSTGIRKQTMLLLSIGFFIVISDEMLNGLLGFEFGFNEKQLGLLTAGLLFLSALASQLTPVIKRSLGNNNSLLAIALILMVSLFVSPFAGFVLGGTALLVRYSLQAIFGNISSIIVNEHTDSRYRATTLSTFNMAKNLPYVISAYLIGSLSDIYRAKNIAAVLGLLLFLLLIAQFNLKKKTLTYR